MLSLFPAKKNKFIIKDDQVYERSQNVPVDSNSHSRITLYLESIELLLSLIITISAYLQRY